MHVQQSQQNLGGKPTYRKFFTTVLEDAKLLGELTSGDSQLAPLRKCILAKEKNSSATSQDVTTVKNDWVIIDNRVAVPKA